MRPKKAAGFSMPIVRSFTVPTVLLGFVLASHAGLIETVSNGSFERTDTEGNPEMWILQSQELSIDVEESDAKGGGLSLKISDTGTSGSAFVKQEIDLGGSGFSGATLRGQIRTEGVSPSATLVAILEGPEGRIFVDDMRDRVVRGSTDWQDYAIHIPPSEEALRLTVGVLVIGAGIAWFDNLELAKTVGQQGVSSRDLQAYVLEAVSIMKRHYLLSDEVDWGRIEELGLGVLSEDGSMAQAHAAIFTMIEALDDPHASARRPRTSRSDDVQRRGVEPAHVALASDRIALVEIPPVPSGASGDAHAEFVQKTYEDLKLIDSSILCGWVVDLRENTGGNMWPMLAAIGPIAGPGVLGHFVGEEGEQLGSWLYRNGVASLTSQKRTEDKIAVSDSPFQPGDPDLPVAVLVSEQTSSSGEAAAIAFIGRQDTRLFGTATGGLTTANNTFRMSDDLQINLPIAYMADRLGNPHDPRVEPHEYIAPDMVLEHAKRWLQAQPACMQ